MSLLNNKKGQAIDTEVLTSPGFLVLTALAVGGTALGWIGGKEMGFAAFPFYQVALFMLVEVVICYIIAIKMLD